MKKYLEEVVKVKMGVTSVSLPKWKGKEIMADSEIGSHDKSALKYKKVTAYTEAVKGSYRALRNITATTIYVGGSEYVQITWLGTRYTDDSSYLCYINASGSPNFYYRTYNAFGIRPAIEY